MPLGSRPFLIWYFCLILLVSEIGCRKQETFKIGYVGGLVSKTGDLGLSGREGATLAVELHNHLPGSVQIDLVAVNDAQEQQDLETSIRYLVDQQVEGIVGPMTSSMTQFALPLINQHRLLTISPTSSSWYLDELDDYLFRIYPSSKKMGAVLAEWASTNNIHSVGIIKDLDNAVHAEAFAEVFAGKVEELGSEVKFNLSYRASGNPVFSTMLDRIQDWPEALLLLCNSSDSALICQQLWKRRLRIQVLASEWSVSPTVFMMGGKSIEGMIVVSATDPSCETERYQAFQSAYRNRFDREADFAAVLTFDATNMLIEALLSRQDPKHHLLVRDTFEALQGPFSFDKYGDSVQPIHLVRVVNGKLVTIQ